MIKKLLILFTLLLPQAFSFGQSSSFYQTISTVNGLPSNFVFGLCEDEAGFLWVGTDKGLCRYNGFSWQVWDRDDGLPGNYIYKIFSDKRGGLWIGISEKGLYHFDIAKEKPQLVALPSEIWGNNLQTDTNGDLLLEKPLGNGKIGGFLYKPSSVNKAMQVYEYTIQPNIFIRGDSKLKITYAVVQGEAKNNLNKILYKGIWTLKTITLPSTDKSAILYFASDTTVVTNTCYYKFNKHGQLINHHDLFNNNNNYAYCLVTDKGYYVYDIKTGYNFISHKGEKTFYDNKSGLGSDYVNQVYELRDGTIVFATLGAGLRLVKNNYKQSFATENRITRSIISEGELWYVLANEKVYTINKKNGAFNSIGTVPNSALTLYKSQERILVGSLKGINFYTANPPLQPVQFISINSGISSIVKNKNNYIASTYGLGLISFDEKNAGYVSLPCNMRIVEKTIPLTNGYALLSYEDGVILVDTVHSKNIQITQKDGLLSNSIHSIFQNNDTTWICSKKGINIFSKGRVIKTLSYADGFSGSKAMFCFKDNKGKIWVVSDRSLHLYDGNKLKALTSYPLVHDQHDMIYSASYDAATNTLAIGSTNSISLVSINNIFPDTAIITPVLISAVVDNADQKSSFIKVPYNFKNISFRIAPFAASPLSQGVMYYKLDGVEENWKELKDSLSFSYSELRPGTYKLIARIVNPDGYESKETLLATFKVEKPFWFRGWFIILFSLLIIAVTAVVVKKTERLRRRKQKAELLVQQSLQNERERISKDLHDHLGSNLVTIVAQVDNIENKLYNQAYDEAATTVGQLSVQTREVMNVLRETIWAVQENEHSLQSFILRIRTFLQRLFESTSVSWQLDAVNTEDIKLSPKQTLHLFRIIQETSQNIIKHSKATKVFYKFLVDEKILKIVISDNGIGLETNATNHSNGMLYMKQRADEINARINFKTNGGTVVEVTVPILDQNLK